MQLLASAAGYAWDLQTQTSLKAPNLSLYGTHDDGRHWQHTQITILGLTSASAPNPPRPLVDFTDADHGWLLIDGTAWHTSDAGQTWHGP